jgi:hypothetical protein
VWRCARCGDEKQLRAVPHQSPVCCGTGMWWQRFVQGPSYLVDDARPDQQPQSCK